jgi:hypothetical protein
MAMRRIFTLLLLLTLCISAVPTVIDAPQILTFAQQCLPHQGVLEKTEIGFVYVKVSDDYIYQTVKLLENGKAYHARLETWNLDRAKAPGFNDRKRVNIRNMNPFAIVESRELSRGPRPKFLAARGIKAPPYFGPGRVGAHITVMDADETQGKNLDLPQLGKSIAFTIVNFASVDVVDENGSRRIYLFHVDAPELAQIRKANGLPPKVRGFDFHITVATQFLSKSQI